MAEPLSYRDAGVDLEAARRHTDALAALVAGETGFAAAQPLPAGMREPTLVTCTDGVGTKLLLARELGRLEGLGQDLVAMCVNDLACTGAQPLVFLDYLAVGRLDPDEGGALVRAIAAACEAVGCRLAGGETAEMPGLYAPGHFDLAGFAAGVVERAEMLGPHRVREGDAIVGLPSSGLHANGYSLVRALVAAGALDPDPDLLLAPTRLYVRELQAIAAAVDLHAAAHITGGGLPENLPRALPEGLERSCGPAHGRPGPRSRRSGPPGAWTTRRPGAPSTWASGCARSSRTATRRPRPSTGRGWSGGSRRAEA